MQQIINANWRWINATVFKQFIAIIYSNLADTSYCNKKLSPLYTSTGINLYNWYVNKNKNRNIQVSNKATVTHNYRLHSIAPFLSDKLISTTVNI